MTSISLYFQQKETLMELFRREAEQCDFFEDIIIQSSMMGGTGSGTCFKFSENVSIQYRKKIKLQVKVVPSPNMLGNDPLTAFNTILGFNVEHSDCDLWFDNNCLYRICEQQYGIQSPSFIDANKLIAESVSSLTHPKRFGGSNNSKFSNILLNIRPYHRVHHFAVSRPFISAE